MKKTHTVRAFLAGVLVTLLFVGVFPSAVAATAERSITIYPGISIFIDDQKLNPTDANGNPVEVFAYNGTTYLPIRAISEALGQPVQWDGSTRSVYVGKHSSDKPAVWLSQMDYFTGSSRINTAATERDNMGTTHYNCITYSFDRTYLLSGQYSRMTGTLYQTYERRSDSIRYDGYGVSIYGDGNLLYAYSPERGTQGMKPVNFDVPLNGVLELKVVFESSANSYNTLSLGDVGLWT